MTKEKIEKFKNDIKTIAYRRSNVSSEDVRQTQERLEVCANCVEAEKIISDFKKRNSKLTLSAKMPIWFNKVVGITFLFIVLISIIEIRGGSGRVKFGDAEIEYTSLIRNNKSVTNVKVTAQQNDVLVELLYNLASDAIVRFTTWGGPPENIHKNTANLNYIKSAIASPELRERLYRKHGESAAIMEREISKPKNDPTSQN